MFFVRGWDREETENTDPTPLTLLSNVPSVCVCTIINQWIMILVRGWERDETENTDPTPLPLPSNVPSVCTIINQWTIVESEYFFQALVSASAPPVRTNESFFGCGNTITDQTFSDHENFEEEKFYQTEILLDFFTLSDYPIKPSFGSGFSGLLGSGFGIQIRGLKKDLKC